MYTQNDDHMKDANAPLLNQEPHYEVPIHYYQELHNGPICGSEQQSHEQQYECLVPSSHIPTHQNNPFQYNANAQNPKSTRIVKFGSILLFIGTFLIALLLVSEIIGVSQYYRYSNESNGEYPLNSIAGIAAKTFLMIINVVLMITSGVLGIVSTSDKNSTKSKYSLLHVVCLSIGMIVFLCEIIIVNISFFTTGYSITNAYGAVFFMLLSCCGLISCCTCCVSGCVRYSDISANTKEVSV